MEMVKMIASVAGEEVFCGECHPARARVLVKRELASWKEGKVLLHVLGVHDKMLASNPHAIRGPLDDENVSKLELERRLAWFRSFMEKSTRRLTKNFVELPSKEAAEEWARKNNPELLGASHNALLRGDPSWEAGGGSAIVVGLPLGKREEASPEDQAAFEKECGETSEVFRTLLFPKETVSLGMSAGLWGEENADELKEGTVEDLLANEPSGEEPATERLPPDVGAIFGVTSSRDAPVVTSREEYLALIEKDKKLLAQYLATHDLGDLPVQEVATLAQVRFVWAQG